MPSPAVQKLLDALHTWREAIEIERVAQATLAANPQSPIAIADAAQTRANAAAARIAYVQAAGSAGVPPIDSLRSDVETLLAAPTPNPRDLALLADKIQRSYPGDEEATSLVSRLLARIAVAPPAVRIPPQEPSPPPALPTNPIPVPSPRIPTGAVLPPSGSTSDVLTAFALVGIPIGLAWLWGRRRS